MQEVLEEVVVQYVRRWIQELEVGDLAPAGGITLDAAQGIAVGEIETHTLVLETLGSITDLAGAVQGQTATLNAGGSITLGPMICVELNAAAGGTLSLETTVEALEAVAGGDIVVVESGSILLRSLSSTSGTVTVTAGAATSRT